MPRKKNIPQTVDPENSGEVPTFDASQQQSSTLVAQSSQNGIRDETRKTIATVYIYAFLGIIGLTLVFMLLRCYTIADIKDILLAESGILSGPLGFIIGFYFKEESDKKGNL